MKNRKKVLVTMLLVLASAIIIIAALLVKKRGENTEGPILHNPYPAVEQAAENTSPAGAVAGLLSALRDWDLGLAAQWMSQVEDGVFSDAYHGVLAPMLGRIEFETGSERIDGAAAMVDVSVYAVDLGGALGDLTADAAGYLLHCALEKIEPDWPEFLEAYVEKLDVTSLIRVKRTSTAHLVMDAGGKWRLDAASPDNRDFYNAVTGGLLDVMENLRRVTAETV